MIRSFLDTDLYSFTVMFFYQQKLPRAKGVYTFTDRNKTKYPVGFGVELQKRINRFKYIQLQDEEKEYLKKTLYYLPEYFIDLCLGGYQFDPNEVKITQSKEGYLDIKVLLVLEYLKN